MSRSVVSSTWNWRSLPANKSSTFAIWGADDIVFFWNHFRHEVSCIDITQCKRMNTLYFTRITFSCCFGMRLFCLSVWIAYDGSLKVTFYVTSYYILTTNIWVDDEGALHPLNSVYCIYWYFTLLTRCWSLQLWIFLLVKGTYLHLNRLVGKFQSSPHAWLPLLSATTAN